MLRLLRPHRIFVAHRFFGTRSQRSAASQSLSKQAKADPVLTAQLFEKIHTALSEMISKNSDFTVRVLPNTCTISAGKFVVTIENSDGVLTYRSDKSGPFEYFYDGDAWREKQSGHNLLELLSRELVYVAKGYPLF